ncbi:hypothetical protein [Leptolyngbya ohadii]|uniref:hypothetical protein n=1 Tax=Leptolyngbya ohadii TaxID=1962290 RepID=UPI0015C64F88|nr:hypothetical protein [Leptolyngbya ohadii]
MPPESGINTEIAAIWFAALLSSGVSPLLLKMGNCEIQTPVLAPVMLPIDFLIWL